jgi:hypothetical protein
MLLATLLIGLTLVATIDTATAVVARLSRR